MYMRCVCVSGISERCDVNVKLGESLVVMRSRYNTHGHALSHILRIQPWRLAKAFLFCLLITGGRSAKRLPSLSFALGYPLLSHSVLAGTVEEQGKWLNFSCFLFKFNMAAPFFLTHFYCAELKGRGWWLDLRGQGPYSSLMFSSRGAWGARPPLLLLFCLSPLLAIEGGGGSCGLNATPYHL